MHAQIPENHWQCECSKSDDPGTNAGTHYPCIFWNLCVKGALVKTVGSLLRLLNHTANACLHLQQNSQTNKKGYRVFCHLRGRWRSPSLWSDVSGLWRLCRGDDRLTEGFQCRRRAIMWGKWGRVSAWAGRSDWSAAFWCWVRRPRMGDGSGWGFRSTKDIFQHVSVSVKPWQRICSKC